ncbi:MAG: YaaL family protein [Tyzzerella sp.]|nr:YaaL family protein [Tyzzerella sp.]
MNLFKKTPQRSNLDYELLQEIERVKTQMDNAYTNFQNAMDPDLIDCYIFESNAAWKRYRFLIRQAKELRT